MGGRQPGVGRGLGSVSKGGFWIFLGFLEWVCGRGKLEVEKGSETTAKANLVGLETSPKLGSSSWRHAIEVHL